MTDESNFNLLAERLETQNDDEGDINEACHPSEGAVDVRSVDDWEQLLNTIQDIPQFEDFLRPRKFADIMSGLPESEGPIITINMHRDRCDALAFVAGASHEPIHIPLKFSFREAELLSNGFRSYLQTVGIRSRPDNQLDAGDECVDFPTVLQVLWSEVVRPILEALSFSIPDSGTKIAPHMVVPDGAPCISSHPCCCALA